MIRKKQNRMKLVNFQSQSLVVDYISCKFQHLDNSPETKIANYFLKIRFNSYQESGKLVKLIREPILVNSKNKFEALFVREGPYLEYSILRFSGSNANLFIVLLKKYSFLGKFFLQKFFIGLISVFLETTKRKIKY
jgi:hypothetical protein